MREKSFSNVNNKHGIIASWLAGEWGLGCMQNEEVEAVPEQRREKANMARRISSSSEWSEQDGVGCASREQRVD